MIAAFALFMSTAVAGSEIKVGQWHIVCENDALAIDGKFDRCRIRSKQDGMEITIVRDSEGAQFSAKIKNCRPSQPLGASVRIASQLTGKNADTLMMGGVIEQIVLNCRESIHGPGALVMPITEADAHEILAATANLRPKAPNAQTH